ncbi:MAG: DUF4349 domain-containing protein [Nocardioides sp.]
MRITTRPSAALIAPLFPLVAVVLAALLLTACGSGSNDSAGESAGDIAADSLSSEPEAGIEAGAPDGTLSEDKGDEVAPGSPGDGADDSRRTAVQERAIIATGSIGVRTKDVAAAATKLRGMITAARGTISTESIDGFEKGKPSYLTMTVRVPSTQFDSVLTRVGELGEVTHHSLGTEDVTTQVIDVDARIRAQERSVQRIQVLLGKAESLSDIVTIEGELTRRQADLDSLRGQQAWLKDQTSMSTIEVTLSTREDAEDPEPQGGFLGGLKQGWNALGEGFAAALTILGWALPFLIIGVPVLWVWRLLRRSRRQETPAPAAPTPPAASADEPAAV